MLHFAQKSPQFATKNHLPEDRVCNFGSETAAWAINEIVKKQDIMAARERIKNNVEVGLTMKEKLQKSKKITAGILTASGKYRLNRYVHSEIKDRKR